jgi:hypothetical protein
MYDIIGNVTDEKNAPIVGVLVEDGNKSTTTDANGYYEIKTTNKLIKFTKNGFKPQAFNLSVYKDNSSVNNDVKLLSETPQTTLTNDDTKTITPQKKLNKTLIWSLVGVGVALVSFVIYKVAKKGK